jgi:hypothetical protein
LRYNLSSVLINFDQVRLFLPVLSSLSDRLLLFLQTFASQPRYRALDNPFPNPSMQFSARPCHLDIDDTGNVSINLLDDHTQDCRYVRWGSCLRVGQRGGQAFALLMRGCCRSMTIIITVMMATR